MQARFVVLGAGFAGLELATVLSEALGNDAGVTLIDENDTFVFGYSKLDVMFGTGNEFYSVAGAERLREVLPTFSRGRAIVGVCGAPFKCPPAPSEVALLLHDYLSQRGVRDNCEISLVMPFATPVPPSPDTSAALLAAFAERGIEFVPGRLVSSLEPGRGVAVLDDGTEWPYDLFLVSRNTAPLTSSSRAGWPQTATYLWIRERSRPL